MPSKYLKDVPWNSKHVQEEKERMEKKCIQFAPHATDQKTNERLINAFMDMARSANMSDICDINIRKYDGEKLNIAFTDDPSSSAHYDLATNTFKISGTEKNGHIASAWASAFNTYWGNHIDTEAQYQFLVEKIEAFKKADHSLSQLQNVITSFTPYVNKKVATKADMAKIKTTYWASLKPIIFDNMMHKDYMKVKCTKKSEHSEQIYETDIEIPADYFELYRKQGRNVCGWMPFTKGANYRSSYWDYHYKSHEPFKKRMSNSLEQYSSLNQASHRNFEEIFEAVVHDSAKNDYLISPIKKENELKDKELEKWKPLLRKLLSDI